MTRLFALGVVGLALAVSSAEACTKFTVSGTATAPTKLRGVR